MIQFLLVMKVLFFRAILQLYSTEIENNVIEVQPFNSKMSFQTIYP